MRIAQIYTNFMLGYAWLCSAWHLFTSSLAVDLRTSQNVKTTSCSVPAILLQCNMLYMFSYHRNTDTLFCIAGYCIHYFPLYRNLFDYTLCIGLHCAVQYTALHWIAFCYAAYFSISFPTLTSPCFTLTHITSHHVTSHLITR